MKRLGKILPIRKMENKSPQQEEDDDKDRGRRKATTSGTSVGTNRAGESLDQDRTQPHQHTISEEDITDSTRLDLRDKNNPNDNISDVNIQPPPSIIRTNATTTTTMIEGELVEKISTSHHHEDDDETSSRYYFLSEPSLSEEASSHLSVSHHGPSNNNFGHGNFAYYSSPGNTSISSKDCKTHPIDRNNLIIDGNFHLEDMKQEYQPYNSPIPQDKPVTSLDELQDLDDKNVKKKGSFSDGLSEDDVSVDQLLRFGAQIDKVAAQEPQDHQFLEGVSYSKDSDKSMIRFSDSDVSSVDISYESEGFACDDKDQTSKPKKSITEQNAKSGDDVKRQSTASKPSTNVMNMKPDQSPFSFQRQQSNDDDDQRVLLKSVDSDTIDTTPIHHSGLEENKTDYTSIASTDIGRKKSPLTKHPKSKDGTDDTKISLPQPCQETQDRDEEITTPRRKTRSLLEFDEERKKEVENENGKVAKVTDDEQISYRPRRKRLYSSDGSKRSGHRRTRSGDDAAASFLPGGIDWKGMEIDNLPLPDPNCVDDDDDEEDILKALGGSSIKPSTASRRKRRTMSDTKLLKAKHSPSAKQRSQRSKSLGDVVLLEPEPEKEILEVKMNAEKSLIPETAEELSLQYSDKQTENISSRSHQGDEMKEKGISDDRKSLSEVSQEDSHGYESSFSWISKGLSVVSGKHGRYPIYNEASQHWSNNEQSNGVESSFEKGGVEESKRLFAAMKEESLSMRDPNSDSRHFHSTDEFRTTVRMSDNSRISLLPRKPGWYDQDEEPDRKKFFESINSTESFQMNPSVDLKASDSNKYPAFSFPNHGESITVATDPNKIDGPLHYLGKYFIIYVVASLFIFGLEEGWPALDCLYFAIMTLTTTGLGDYVPTTDSAKIICSIFIYFGVACIGLLLGSLHASSLDDDSRHLTREFLSSTYSSSVRKIDNDEFLTSLNRMNYEPSMHKDSFRLDQKNLIHPLQTIDESMHGQSESLHSSSGSLLQSKLPQSQLSQDMSPGPRSSKTSMTSIGHPPHTRHLSLESQNLPLFEARDGKMGGIQSAENLHMAANTQQMHSEVFDDGRVSPYSAWSYGDTDTSEGSTIYQQPVNNVKAAKFIFLSLRQAAANSALIIFIGSIGFYYIEQWGAVNSFYFTMSLLTTVGYGDIVPQTKGGKLFASIFSLIAGTVLLTNMSMISMIPVELRKMRIEQLVLNQFVDDYDDMAVREVAAIIRRLQMSTSRPDGLGKCSRETFALAMLMRLGRISERDVQATFAAFRRLEKDGNDILTGKDLIVNELEQIKKEQGSPMSITKSTLWQQNETKIPDTKPSIGLRQSSAPPLYSTSSEHASLLHPLASQKSTINSAHSSYSSITATTARLDDKGSRGRGFSIESALSAITDDLEGGDYQGQYNY